MTVLDGTGHLSPLEVPDQIANLIDQFVAAVSIEEGISMADDAVTRNLESIDEFDFTAGIERPRVKKTSNADHFAVTCA
jgi:hypothetical protein